MLALYRKYRPQTFAGITGQEHVKITLGNQVATDSVAHAYLFTGLRGTGKTTTARILAKAVNCLERAAGASEPCNHCRACEEITAGKAVDVLEIDAASNTGVDNVRENIIESVRFTPTMLKKKVFIVDEVHMLSASAFNALLKTLEEPPAHALFILATTELHKVPETIVSRCQRFDFKKIASPEIARRLSVIAAGEGRTVAPEVLAVIARHAQGSVRDAESLLGQVFAVGEGHIGEEEASLVLPRSDAALALRFLEAALGGNAGEALRLIATVGEEGMDPLRFTDEVISLLRTTLLALLERDTDALAGAFEKDVEDGIRRLARDCSVGRAAAAIELLLGKRQELKTSDAGLLPLELAAVALAHAPKVSVPSHPFSSPLTPSHPVSSHLPPSLPSDHSPQPAGDATTTIQQVKNQWTNFLRAVGDVNHSLPFVLNVSVPLRVEGRTLVLGSRYPFHCDRLNSEKHEQILREACEKVFGEPLRVAAEVSEDTPEGGLSEVEPLSAPAETDPALKAIMDALGGGKVVG